MLGRELERELGRVVLVLRHGQAVTALNVSTTRARKTHGTARGIAGKRIACARSPLGDYYSVRSSVDDGQSTARGEIQHKFCRPGIIRMSCAALVAHISGAYVVLIPITHCALRLESTARVAVASKSVESRGEERAINSSIWTPEILIGKGIISWYQEESVEYDAQALHGKPALGF